MCDMRSTFLTLYRIASLMRKKLLIRFPLKVFWISPISRISIIYFNIHIEFQLNVSFCVTLHTHCLNCKDDEREISHIS